VFTAVLFSLQWPVGMDQDLCVSIDPLVELVVGHLGIINANLMADHKRGFRLARNDQISQIPVILLDIALSCA
jgi:hypothetical protein